jgi:hypothetical protein
LNKNLPQLDPKTSEGMQQIENILSFLARTIEFERG